MKNKHALWAFVITFVVLLFVVFLWSQRSNTFPITTPNSETANPALKKAIADYYIHFKLIDPNLGGCTVPQDSDYEALPRDLNGDGINEYIVSINFACGTDHPLRSGSGGQGDYVIFKKSGDQYVKEGMVFGSSYGISPIQANGRSIIYTTEKLNAAYQSINEWQWNSDVAKYEMIKLGFAVTLKTNWIDGAYHPIYSFYREQYAAGMKPLMEVESPIPLQEMKFLDGPSLPRLGDSIDHGRYFRKDITGDGIGEFFIKTETTGYSLSGYEIFRWDGDKLIHIVVQGSNISNPNYIVHFDDISFQAGYVYMTDHSRFTRGETIFIIQGDSLIPFKRIGFFISPNAEEDEYEVRETVGSSTKILGKKQGNIWTDSFEPYE